MVIGEHGVYKVYDDQPHYDGSILLYGGDKDPRGVHGFRSVLLERIKPDTRKHLSAKLNTLVKPVEGVDDDD
jgi:hypothetical protein